MWVYCTDKIKLYQYTQTRNGENAVSFLNGYTGYLVCDGYDGYNKLKDITRCECWAHARRKFYEALPTDEEIRKTSRANEGFERINKIFALEREYATLSPEERHTKRQAKARRGSFPCSFLPCRRRGSQATHRKIHTKPDGKRRTEDRILRSACLPHRQRSRWR